MSEEKIANPIQSGKEFYSVGFIVPDIINPFYAALTDELEQLCRTFGLQLVIGYSRDDIENERDLIENFLKRGIDALVLSSAAKEELPYPYDIPIVYVDRQLKSHSHHLVSTDHTEGALLLLDEFNKDYEGDFAFIGACEELASSVQRLDAFKKHLDDNNGILREDLIFHGLSHSVETGRKAYHHFRSLLIIEPEVSDNEESEEEFTEEEPELEFKEKLRFFFTSYPLLEGFVIEMQKNEDYFVELPLGSFDCPHSFELFPYPLVCMRQDIEKIATEILICLKSKDKSNLTLIMPKLLSK